MGYGSISQSIATTLHNGETIFQTSLSRQSEPIQLATHSPYSHVGIVYVKDGKTYVFKAVQPVKLAPFDVWIERCKDDQCMVKRIKHTSNLTPDNLKAMRAMGEACWLTHPSSHPGHLGMGCRLD